MEEERKSGSDGTDVIHRIARFFISFGDGFANLARKIFDDSEFRRGRATTYPEVPGEANRNPGLEGMRENYSPSLITMQRRDSSGSGRSGLSRQRSSGPAESVNVRGKTKRRDTLEVPSGQHHGVLLQGNLSRCVSETGYGVARTETTPTIVVYPSPVYTGTKSIRHTTETTVRYERPGPSTSEPGRERATETTT
jgi:hypothetical protein